MLPDIHESGASFDEATPRISFRSSRRWLQRSPSLEMRVVPRDAREALVDAHLTGTSRSILVVTLLDEEFERAGVVGPATRSASALGSG